MSGARRAQSPGPIRRSLLSIPKGMDSSLVLVFGVISQQLLITFCFHRQEMLLMLKYILCALTAIVALAATDSSAVGVTSVRQFNLLHNNTNSPFFATSVDAVNTFAPATYPTVPIASESVVFTPDGAPR